MLAPMLPQGPYGPTSPNNFIYPENEKRQHERQ